MCSAQWYLKLQIGVLLRVFLLWKPGSSILMANSQMIQTWLSKLIKNMWMLPSTFSGAWGRLRGSSLKKSEWRWCLSRTNCCRMRSGDWTSAGRMRQASPNSWVSLWESTSHQSAWWTIYMRPWKTGWQKHEGIHSLWWWGLRWPTNLSCVFFGICSLCGLGTWCNSRNGIRP